MPFPPPVTPISLLRASPGPLTIQPIIETVIDFFICESFCSRVLTVSITGNACLAQEGHEIIFTPLDLKSKLFKIS